MQDRVKSTFELDANAKRKLGMLRLDLRQAGYRATERLIVETLIEEASFDHLKRKIPRRQRSKRAN